MGQNVYRMILLPTLATKQSAGCILPLLCIFSQSTVCRPQSYSKCLLDFRSKSYSCSWGNAVELLLCQKIPHGKGGWGKGLIEATIFLGISYYKKLLRTNFSKCQYRLTKLPNGMYTCKLTSCEPKWPIFEINRCIKNKFQTN